MRCLLRGSLLLLILAALGALFLCAFYAEEDWRGAHEWAVAQQNLRNAGESYNFNDYIPPKIPDSENLAAIPLFKVECGPEGGSWGDAKNLKNALANIDTSSDLFSKTGNWQKAESTDFSRIKTGIDDGYQKVFGYPAVNLSTLEKIDALCPAINELHEAAKTRKRARFDQDYETQPPFARSFSLTVEILYLIKVLNLHAIAALSENRADIALKDIEIAQTLRNGLAQEPLLVSGLVSIATSSIQMGSIWNGFNRHAWSDQQLDELQKGLREIDFISTYQLCLRGEAVGQFAQSIDWLRDNSQRDRVVTLLNGKADWIVFLSYCPHGWVNMSKARVVTLYYKAAREATQPNTHCVDARRADQIRTEIESISKYDLPSLIVRLSAPSVVRAISKFAEAQFWVDSASIACSLEKYRLAKGVYPASLKELSDYSALPRDVMNGEPYHYKVLPNGKYLLYSVGWNGTDDGGVTVYQKVNPNSIDRDHGDWVWPAP